MGENAQSETEAHYPEPEEGSTAIEEHTEPEKRPETPQAPIITFSDESSTRPFRDSSEFPDLLLLSPC